MSASRLPYVDEHAVSIAAGPAQTWAALLRVAEGSFGAPAATRFARALGCADTAAAGPRPLAVGSAFPGFHVEAAEPERELVLAGNHRFSQYALIFRLEPQGAGRTLLHAETRAEFPGLAGSAYRALVIGTRGHVLATRRLLATVRRGAERR
jgi:hypothetical protein